MSKSLQQQLLQKGLINDKKAKAVSKDKYNALKNQRRNNKSAATEGSSTSSGTVELARQAQKTRDRELNLQYQARADKKAIAAQIIQLIEQYKLGRESADVDYNFEDNKIIKKIAVTQVMSKEISRGRLCIARQGNSYEVIPLPVADKIRERDASVLVVYNIDTLEQNMSNSEDADQAFYTQFEIPDDLIW